MTRLVDARGYPIDQSILREPQTAQSANLHREFGRHPSRGLTPAGLARLFDAAEIGNLTLQAELYQDMEEKDAHLFAELSKRKRALLTLDWAIEPPRHASAAEKAEAEEVGELIRQAPNLEDVFLDMLDAVGHGFSNLEIQWQRIGKLWLPECIEHRPQGWFVMDAQTRTQINLRTPGKANGEPLQPFGWISHVHKAKSGYIARAGLHRILAWPYIYKNYAVRDLAEFIEIYGLPLRLGKYPAGSQDEEKNTLLAALVDIGHNAAGIIPSEMEIEFQEAAKGTHQPFEYQIAQAERQMSKAILGGTLTSGSDGKSSTNALGNVHNEVRHDLLVSDARQLESTLARDLIYPLIALNRPITDPRRLPRLCFDTREAEDLAVYADALPKIVSVGMQVPVSWAANKLRIPAPKDNEPVLRPVAVAGVPHSDGQAPGDVAAKPATKAKPPTAAARAVLAALNAAPSHEFPDQAALDAAITALPAAAMQAAVEAIVKPALEALRAGASPDDAMDKLIDAYPAMDAATLTTLLARAMFVADVWGRLSAND